jgi:hypothetical protein
LWQKVARVIKTRKLIFVWVQLPLSFMEKIFTQNYYQTYPFLIRTRRNIALKKMYLTPLVFNYIFWRAFEALHVFRDKKYNNTLKVMNYYYLDLNIYFFFRNILIKKHGSLTNNLTLSYTYWPIVNSINNLQLLRTKQWVKSQETKGSRVLTEIKLVPFRLQKLTFNKLTFLILFFLLQPYSIFSTSLNITYSFLLISRHSNLFPFYSCFYFKVHNY